MEGSGSDAILRVVGIFSSEIFMSTKWGWHCFGGVSCFRGWLYVEKLL